MTWNRSVEMIKQVREKWWKDINLWPVGQKNMSCIYVDEVPKGEWGENGTCKIFEDTMAENFPELRKIIKPQIQEAQ